MLYLGLDASTKSTGYCFMDENKEIIKTGCITASNKDVIVRIRKMVENLMQTMAKVMDEHNEEISYIILEEVRPPQGDEYGSGNLQTHRVLMWLQGAINGLAFDNGIKVDYILPSSWRKNCGIKQGGLTRTSLKQKDVQWVQEKYQLTVNDDEADAIGVVYGYLNKEVKKDFNWE